MTLDEAATLTQSLRRIRKLVEDAQDNAHRRPVRAVSMLDEAAGALMRLELAVGQSARR